MNLPLLALAGVLLFSQDPSTDQANAIPAAPAGAQLGAESNSVPALNRVNPAKPAIDKTSALEHSAGFRKAAEEAWRATHNGAAPFEAGFSIDKDGRAGQIQLSIFETVNAKTHLRIVSSSTALGSLHVHTKYGEPTPSPADINSAKTLHKVVYVESRKGLYRIDADGNVCHVFDDEDWFDKK